MLTTLTMLLAVSAAAEPLPEPPPGEGQPEEIVIVAAKASTGASDRTLDAADVLALPGRSTDEVLRAMPGLQMSAHGGRGKAYQYLIRGFDADHGADIAVDVEGIPINEVSNIHGHGYLDLHFVPSILVHQVDLHVGGGAAQPGDFAIAASASMKLGLDVDGALIRIGGGTDRSGTALFAWHPPGSAPGNFVEADIDAGLGVTDGRSWRQARTAWGMEHGTGKANWRLLLMGYDGAFDSPGALRQDDLDAGRVGFYEAYDNAGGGRSSRGLISASVDWATSPVRGHLTAYAMLRRFDLTSNFTGSWKDEEHGDAINQREHGAQLGARGELAWAPPTLHHKLTVHAGLDLRGDLLRQHEQRVDTQGEPWAALVDADVHQLDAGAWLSLQARPNRWWTFTPGLRTEILAVDLVRRIGDDGQTLSTPADARSWAPVLAPRISTSLHPIRQLDLMLSYGRGFRSPQARGIEDGDRAPVARTDSGELGLVARPVDGLELHAATFVTSMSDEIVFDPSTARFLSTGTTRRVGGEVGITWQPFEQLRVQLDGSYADGRYVASGEAIPNAPRLLASLGIYTTSLPIGPTRWTTGLRARVVGPRPLPEGLTSHTAVAGELSLHGEWNRWVLDLDLENAFFNHWRDGEFAYASRWDTSRARSELSVSHFTAGDPTALQLAIGRRF